MRILAVRGDKVSIGAGTRDGIRVGDVFSISRGYRYVGRVTITHLDEGLAVGTFDPDGGTLAPQPNDRANLDSN